MISTHVPERSTRLDDTQCDYIVGEGFLTFGNCLTWQELIAARMAYERVMEQFHADDPRFGGGDMEHAALLSAFCDQPALTKHIANPTILAIARAALGTDDLQYTGSILRRTWFGAKWLLEGGFGPWHSDYWLKGDAETVRDDRVAIWIYLDDVTQAEGATQIILGSSDVVRHAQINSYDYNQVMEAALANGDSVLNTFGEAPAGGGMAFKSRVLHRAIPNTSGVPRRVLTMDYRVRGTTEVPDGDWQKLPEEIKAPLRQSLPESAQYLLR